MKSGSRDGLAAKGLLNLLPCEKQECQITLCN